MQLGSSAHYIFDEKPKNKHDADVLCDNVTHAMLFCMNLVSHAWERHIITSYYKKTQIYSMDTMPQIFSKRTQKRKHNTDGLSMHCFLEEKTETQT